MGYQPAQNCIFDSKPLGILNNLLEHKLIKGNIRDTKTLVYSLQPKYTMGTNLKLNLLTFHMSVHFNGYLF